MYSEVNFQEGSIKKRLNKIVNLQKEEKSRLQKLTNNNKQKLNNNDNKDEIEKLRVSIKKRKIEISELQILYNNEKEEGKEEINNMKKPVTFESLHCHDKTIDMEMRRLAIALDCEMVGVGTNGKHSALARCSLVDYDGKVLYDKYVQSKGVVTDFRTQFSGIRMQDINNNKAIPFEQCQKEVADHLRGKILVGHDLKNDLTALLLSHPESQTRDTSRYQPYMNKKSGKYEPLALKNLAIKYLNRTIQTVEHDSIEDASCTMMLFRLVVEKWEKQKRLEAEEEKLKLVSLWNAELESSKNPSEKEIYKKIAEELINSLEDSSKDGRNKILKEKIIPLQKSDKKKLHKMNKKFNKMNKEEKLNNKDLKDELEELKESVEERKIQIIIMHKLNTLEKKARKNINFMKMK